MTRLKRGLSSSLLGLILGLVISSLTLYLALREVNIGDLQLAFQQADPRFIGLALVSVATNILIKIIRWRVLLGSKGRETGFSKISLSFLAAQMLNAVLPVRAGEISRIYVLGRKGIGSAFVLGTITIEKVLDMIAYALLFVLLLLLIPLPDWIGASGFTFAFTALSISLFVFIAACYRGKLIVLLERLIAYIPKRWQISAFAHLEDGLSSLDVSQNRFSMLKLSIETALIWGTAVLTNMLVLLALSIDLPVKASLLILIALLAGISIPSLPGKIGIFEYICVLALGVFGVDRTLALSYGILLHVIIYLPLVIAGLFSLWFLGIDWKKGKTASSFQ